MYECLGRYEKRGLVVDTGTLLEATTDVRGYITPFLHTHPHVVGLHCQLQCGNLLLFRKPLAEGTYLPRWGYGSSGRIAAFLGRYIQWPSRILLASMQVYSPPSGG